MADVSTKPPSPPKATTITAGMKPGRFHVGLKPGSGRQAVDFAGIDFPEVTYGKRTVNGESIHDQRRDGDELDLTAEDLARIDSWKGRKVVRVVDEQSGKTLILGKTSIGFRPQRGDVPLESFLILRPVAAAETVEA